MVPTKPILTGLLIASGLFACGSDESSEPGPKSVCVSGSSILCAGPNGCQGYQICKSDGSGFDACICGGPTSGHGGTPSVTSHVGSGGRTQAATGGAFIAASGGNSSAGTAGAILGGSATTSLGGSSVTTGTPGLCAPTNMSDFVYPTYKPARRLFSSCAEAELQTYYSECYVKGNCAEYRAGGAKAKCGECLAPTKIDATAYGPLIRLGSDASPLDETNMAGCIELMGEAECAKKMMVASLCEYYACANGCPAVDAASYQALMSCMTDARSTSCVAAQAAAVCISNSAHVAACSGSGFEAQFLAVARVFCATSR